MTPGEPQAPDAGLPDALRTAVERTLDLAGKSARAGTAALDEVARRGQEAGAELSRRGQAARDEVSRRLEVLERRLGSIEDLVREQGQSKAKPKG